MSAYWIEFSDRQSGCVEAESKDAAKIVASEFGVVLNVHHLPYPAEPRLGVKSTCPSFCFKPNECKGRGSCPRRISCTE